MYVLVCIPVSFGGASLISVDIREGNVCDRSGQKRPITTGRAAGNSSLCLPPIQERPKDSKYKSRYFQAYSYLEYGKK